MKKTSSKNENYNNLTVQDLIKKGFKKAEIPLEIELKYGCKDCYEYYVKEDEDEVIMIYGIDNSNIIKEIL